MVILDFMDQLMTQGGGHHGVRPLYPYPKWVWSPLGGWWPHPRKWKINTAVVIFGLILVNYPVYLFSNRNEVCCCKLVTLIGRLLSLILVQ